jgi:o-succinylbenzoate---CoA ligase
MLESALDGQGASLCLAATPPAELPSHVSEETALILMTSGSTGSAKAVALSAPALRASVKATHERLGAQPGDLWSLLLPFHHIAGVQVLLRAKALGTPVISGPKEAADFTAIVPTQLRRALDGEQELLEHLQEARAILVGGAPLQPDLRERAGEAGLHLIHTYGMTETCGGCIYDGKPLTGVKVEIGAGERIRIGGPTLALGYLNDISSHRDSFSEGWFLTQDRGEIIDERLRILGRLDDVIISGGENISLSQVEAALRDHPQITDALCIGRPDPLWGEVLVAGIVATAPISLAEIRDHVGDTCGRASAPREIISLSSIPTSDLGKPHRSLLLDLAPTESM